MSCLNKNDAAVQHFIKRYGEDVAEAASTAAASGAPVMIRVNGKLVFSKLFDHISRLEKDKNKAWNEYLDRHLTADRNTALDANGEPIYTKPKRQDSGIKSDLQPALSKAEQLFQKANDKIKALDERMRRNAEKSANQPFSRIDKAMLENAEDRERLDILRFLKYVTGYTIFIAKDVQKKTDIAAADGYSSINPNDIAAFKRFLDTTAEIEDLYEAMLSDVEFGQFIKEAGLAKTFEFVINSRRKATTLIAALTEEYLVNKFSMREGRAHAEFRDKKRRQYLIDNPFVKGSKAQKQVYDEAMNAYIETLVRAEKAELVAQEKAYLRRILVSKNRELNVAQMYFYDAHMMNDDIIQLSVDELDRADFNVRKKVDEKVKDILQVAEAFEAATKDRKGLIEKYDEMIEDLLDIDENGNLKMEDGKAKTIKGKKSRNFVDEFYLQYYEIRAEKTRNLTLTKAKNATILDGARKAVEALNNEGRSKEAKAKLAEYAELENRLAEEEQKAEKELADWHKENSVEGSEINSYEPSEKWLNPQFKVLLDLQAKNSPIAAMYNILVETNEEADEAVGDYAPKLRGKIAQLEKSSYEQADTNGVWKALKRGLERAVTVPTDETAYGQIYDANEQFGSALLNRNTHKVPLFYRRNVELDNLSYDLITSTIMNYQNSINYAEKSAIGAVLEMTRDALAERRIYEGKAFEVEYEAGDESVPGREVITVTDADGRTKKMTKRYVNYKKGTETNEYKAFNSLLEDRLYGIANANAPWAHKLAGAAMSWTSLSMLGLNYSSAMKNSLQGHMQNRIEAWGGGLISRKNIRQAQKLMAANKGAELVKILADSGRVKPTSTSMLFADKFDALTSWKALGRKAADDSFFRRNVNTGLFMAPNNIVEHMIQLELMYAVMDSIMVESDKGPIPLWQAYENKDGRLVVKEGVEMTDELEFRASQRIKDIKKQLQGNYDSNDRAMAQRYVLGQLVMMFRKWMPAGIARRWRGLDNAKFWQVHKQARETRYYNYSTQRFEEGYHTTMLRFVTGFLADSYNKIAHQKRFVYTNWETMSDYEKSNIVKSSIEIGLMILALTAANFLKAMADDEDDEKAKHRLAFTAYIMKSFSQELNFYSGIDTTKLIRNPSAVIKLVEDLGSMIELIYTGDFATDYESGRLAGQNKGLYKFRQLTPFRGLYFDPEFANNFVFK